MSDVPLQANLPRITFSMSVNLLSVLLGVFGLIGPVFGAVMHELSALPVVANSTRLIGWQPALQALRAQPR